MKKYITLGLLLSSISTASTASTLLSAEINNQNIQQLNTFNDPEALNWYQTEMVSCNKDKTCMGRISFTMYEVMFRHSNFSQIGTYINYANWTNSVKDTPSRENIMLSQKWSNAFSGITLCLSDNKCSEWMVKKSYATQEQVNKAKKSL